MIKPQNQFPLLNKYKEVFPIDANSIFAYGDDIYCNYPELPERIVVHENVHLRQQKEFGLDLWVDRYLTDPEFRRAMEIEAFREEIKSIKDKNRRLEIQRICAKKISSPLYGDIIDFKVAMELFNV